MTPKEAADQLRPTFVLAAMPPEDRHHVKFVEDVARELGVEPTSFNLYQVADALDAHNIREDGAEYPKMLYSREHHTVEGVVPSIYDARRDFVHVQVASAEEAEKLGPSWVDDPDNLPPIAQPREHVAEPAPPATAQSPAEAATVAQPASDPAPQSSEPGVSSAPIQPAPIEPPAPDEQHAGTTASE